MISSLVPALISAFKARRKLALENVALRQQLAVLRRSVKRTRLSNVDCGFWVLLRRIWTDWESVLVIVKPETVVRWHRCGFRRYWAWKSRRRRPGRPGVVAPEIHELIRNMSRANPLWGAPRVHGELAKLGISISQAAVSKRGAKRGSPTSCSSNLASASRRAPFGSTYPFEMTAARTGAMRRIAGRHSCGITQKRSSLRISST